MIDALWFQNDPFEGPLIEAVWQKRSMDGEDMQEQVSWKPPAK
jgi:hypothetical protein